jgi:hypothetical protein
VAERQFYHLLGCVLVGTINQDFGAISHNSSKGFGFNGRTEHLA